MTKERILIAGCGYVGNALAERLIGEGHEVWGLRRNVDRLPAGVHPVHADLCDPRSLDLPERLNVVVYAASADGFSKEAYERAYLVGVRNVIHTLEDTGQAPRLFLYTSSTGVYAQTKGEWVDEDTAAESMFFSGRLMLDGEAAALSAPWPASVVRFGGIYGPKRTQFLRSVRDGQSPVPMESCYTNRVHRDDCAGILQHLIVLSHVRALAPIYLGVDSDPADRGEVIRWLAQRMGAPEPSTAVDDDESGHRPRGCKRCRNQRLLDSGYVFRYPTFREGYGALIDDEARGA